MINWFVRNLETLYVKKIIFILSKREFLNIFYERILNFGFILLRLTCVLTNLNMIGLDGCCLVRSGEPSTDICVQKVQP